MISILTPDHPSVVAKVLKPSSSIKSTAVMWLRETSIHSKLSAGGLPTIVQLLGLDARLHSLYLEDIAAPSLAQRAWRGPDDYFSGTPADARRVLDDMASALTSSTRTASRTTTSNPPISSSALPAALCLSTLG